MPYQLFVPPTEVFSVQVAPESVEVQMFPLGTTRASLVPSLEDVMVRQYIPPKGFAMLSSDQLAPESVEVQMLPPSTMAASLVPSLEDVMLIQYCVSDMPQQSGATSVQSAPELVEVQMFPP